MHPLTPPLSNLSDDLLQTKIFDLNKRLMQVVRFGPQGAVYQIRMMLDDYNYEMTNRHRKMLDSLSNDTKSTDTVNLE